MTPEEELAKLQEEFPNGSFIRSDKGRYWGSLPPQGNNPLRTDADADTAEELRAKLRAALDPTADPVEKEPWP